MLAVSVRRATGAVKIVPVKQTPAAIVRAGSSMSSFLAAMTQPATDRVDRKKNKMPKAEEPLSASVPGEVRNKTPAMAKAMAALFLTDSFSFNIKKDKAKTKAGEILVKIEAVIALAYSKPYSKNAVYKTAPSKTEH